MFMVRVVWQLSPVSFSLFSVVVIHQLRRDENKTKKERTKEMLKTKFDLGTSRINKSIRYKNTYNE